MDLYYYSTYFKRHHTNLLLYECYCCTHSVELIYKHCFKLFKLADMHLALFYHAQNALCRSNQYIVSNTNTVGNIDLLRKQVYVGGGSI